MTAKAELLLLDGTWPYFGKNEYVLTDPRISAQWQAHVRNFVADSLLRNPQYKDFKNSFYEAVKEVYKSVSGQEFSAGDLYLMRDHLLKNTRTEISAFELRHPRTKGRIDWKLSGTNSWITSTGIHFAQMEVPEVTLNLTIDLDQQVTDAGNYIFSETGAILTMPVLIGLRGNDGIIGQVVTRCRAGLKQQGEQDVLEPQLLFWEEFKHEYPDDRFQMMLENFGVQKTSPTGLTGYSHK